MNNGAELQRTPDLPPASWTLVLGVTLGLALLLTTAEQSRAQVPNLVEVGTQYIPHVAVGDPDLTAQVTSFRAAINVPVPLSERTFLVPGAEYHVDAVSFSGAPTGFVPLKSFHATDIPVLLVQLLPDEWALSVRFSAGLAGDFAGIDRRMLRLNGLAMATHGFSDNFAAGGGLLATYSFGNLLPLPVGYVNWKPHPRFGVEALFPAFAQTKLILGGRVELGYRADVQGNTYGIRDARLADAWPCRSAPDGRAADRDECIDHVAYSLISAGPTADVRLFSSVWFTTFVGHALYRRLDLMNPSSDTVSGGVLELPQTWLVRAGLTWRVPAGN